MNALSNGIVFKLFLGVDKNLLESIGISSAKVCINEVYRCHAFSRYIKTLCVCTLSMKAFVFKCKIKRD